MKKKFFLFFSFIFFHVYAQPIPATITFIEGDTFDGYADINKHSEIEFRMELTDDVDILNGLDITRVKFNKEPFNIYEYVSINNKFKLLKVLSEGEITAYELDIYSYSTKKSTNKVIREHNSRNGLSNGYYTNNSSGNGFGSVPINGSYNLKRIKFYLKKGNDPAEDIKSSFKKKSNIYFENCPGLLKKIKSQEYKYKNMKIIVDYYNDFCTEL